MPRWPDRRLRTAVCDACGAQFTRYVSQFHGKRTFCSRECQMSVLNAERRQMAKCHPDREHAANGLCVACYQERRYLRVMGWDSIYDELSAKQGGLCAICNNPCKTGKRLSVDHDHETGAVRGLLCRNCNSGIGMFSDSPKLLMRAAEYLERYL